MNNDLLNQLKSFDINKLTTSDDATRQAFSFLLNAVEQLASDNDRLREENQQLKDEINRLKGEQGKPTIRPQKSSGDISSEKERKTKKSRKKKASKKAGARIDRVQHCAVDRSLLPEDAVSKGVEINVVQDVHIQVEQIAFHREVFYSPSLGKRFIGAKPLGYEGAFGPGVKTLVQVLYHDAHMTQPSIVSLLQSCGVSVSAATISRLLTNLPNQFYQERTEIVAAGLQATDYQQIDDTGARVNGKNHYVHVLCSPFYTAYFTRAKKDRLTVLDVLSPGGLTFLLTSEAIELMGTLGLPQKQLARLSAKVTESEYTQLEMDTLLESLFPNPNKHHTNRRLIKEACAMIAYQQRPDAINRLVCDDAPQFKGIAHQEVLCWVHEGRHYKKLKPLIRLHQEQLDSFLTDFWDYYHQLLNYKSHPCQQQALVLSEAFDTLFSRDTSYEVLGERIKKTAAKKDQLLVVLEHPNVPLHNNESELGARRQARKRDVSLQTKNEKGTQAKDTMMTIAQTAKKLGVSLLDYVQDRITGACKMVSLADLIQQQS